MEFTDVESDIPNLPMLPHQIFNHTRQQQQPDNLLSLPHQFFIRHAQQQSQSQSNHLLSSEDELTSFPRTRNHHHHHHQQPRIRVRQGLDFDNIPYEEILEFQERIGNVNTGLSEENITNCLKTRTVTFGDVKNEKIFNDTCIVCQDKYKDNDTIGTLKCGHEYHRDCIKEWLVLKNVCPICKRQALTKTMPIHN